MNGLTVEDLLRIHTVALSAGGGKAEVRDIGRLEAAVATQTQSIFGESIYPTLAKKAAAITRGIIADHPFLDGNKRTGMLSGLTFLSTNGIGLEFKSGEIEDFAVEIATKKLAVDKIAAWFEQHIVKG